MCVSITTTGVRSRRRNPPATSDDEEVFIQNVPGEVDLEINLGDAREAVAAPVVTEQGQPQQPPHGRHLPARVAARREGGETGSRGNGGRRTSSRSRLANCCGGWGPRDTRSSGGGRGTITKDSPGGAGENSQPTSPPGSVKEFVAAGGNWETFT
ncbi:unnamed protein product [Lampetra fluviatilis]